MVQAYVQKNHHFKQQNLEMTHQGNAKELLEYRLGDTPNVEKMAIT
jgi:hypothetical protein